MIIAYALLTLAACIGLLAIMARHYKDHEACRPRLLDTICPLPEPRPAAPPECPHCDRLRAELNDALREKAIHHDNCVAAENRVRELEAQLEGVRP